MNIIRSCSYVILGLSLILDTVNAQIIRDGYKYDAFIQGGNGQQTVVEESGARYTSFGFKANFTIDSAGFPIYVDGRTQNSSMCSHSIVVIKYDSLNRYLFHYLIALYKSAPNCIIKSNMILKPSGYNNHMIWSTLSFVDSLDLIDANGFNFKRIYTPLSRDSTFLLLCKIDENGKFEWVNSISRITNISPNWPTLPLWANADNTKLGTTLAIDNFYESTVNIDLFKDALKPTDSLELVGVNGNITYLKPNGKDIQLRFNTTGVIVRTVSPIRLLKNDSADNIRTFQSISDGTNRYTIASIRLNEKDTIKGLVSTPVDSGITVILFKLNSMDSVEWVKIIGNGAIEPSDYKLDFDKSNFELLIGFSFYPSGFQFKNPINIYPATYTDIFNARLNRFGEIIWNETFGGAQKGCQLIGLAFNPKTKGFLLIGSATGSGQQQITLGNYKFKIDLLGASPRFFLASFDSLNRCLLSEVIKCSTPDYFGLGLFFFGDQYLRIQNPFVDPNGKAYLTGGLSDTLYITCNKKLDASQVPLRNPFVLITGHLNLVDTNVCYSMISNSGKYLYDSTGIYLDTISDINGCDSILIIKLKVLKSGSKIDTSVCASYISPSGKYTVTKDTTIQDTIINLNGCDSIMSIKVTILNSSSMIDTLYCGTYVSPSGKYSITKDSIIYDTLINYFGCDSILKIQAKRKFIIFSFDTSNCNAINSPSGLYIWNESGTYLDTLQTPVGCDSILSIKFDLMKSTSIINPEVCDSFISPSNKFIYKVSGNYYDTVTNMKGCDSIIAIQLKVDPISINISKSNDVTCESTSAILTVTGNFNYQWSPVNTVNNIHSSSPTVNPDTSTLYFVVATNSLGCATLDSIEVLVNKEEKINPLPNVFTPNNDGLNECIWATSVTEFSSVNLTILNRWGTVVFTTNSESECWNGKTESGESLTEGVYFYVLNGESLCGQKITDRGSIMLLR